MTQNLEESIDGKISPQAKAILKLNATAAYTELVVKGPGHDPARQMLQKLQAGDLFIDVPANMENSQAALAALWLWHDWLDESHVISQKISSATGSFWHGIMHRREGDFSNSKYWFARCEGHPALKTIAQQVESAFDRSLVSELTAGGIWHPDCFVDWVERAHLDANHATRARVIKLQQLEWRTLFSFCGT